MPRRRFAASITQAVMGGVTGQEQVGIGDFLGQLLFARSVRKGDEIKPALAQPRIYARTFEFAVGSYRFHTCHF
jgi:hypothetical protein